MKLYYQDDAARITLYHGDCRQGIQSIGEPVDVVAADPPYGETSLGWDSWPRGWISAVGEKVKLTSSMWCFGTLRMFLAHRDEFGFWRFVQDVIWEKHNGSGFHVDRFRRVHETAAHFVRTGTAWADIYKSPRFTMDATAQVTRRKAKPAQWTGARGPTTYISTDGGPRLMRSVLKVRSCHGSALNETQKPLGIVRPLLEYSCPPGGTVLVPFVGSGTDLLVCKELGYRAIGFEIREEQCEIAAKRLAQGLLCFEGGVA